jgi:cellulose biosynthesis protein BcsQ/tetratricopeptide (TPR) repeat protein
MDIDRVGEVITFFSYKGGTGRTMALANVAWILASQGKRVLVVDWDLEAPGLQRFFHPFIEEELLNSTDGVVDILMDYARAATQHTDRSENWHLPYARVMPHAVSLDWAFAGEGTLDIIPAGRPGRGYSNALAGFQWDNFYHRLGGSQLFTAMRDDMRRNYDYTLIDSRTGLSDIAGICTVRFPDTVVDCFTLSTLSIEGAAAVARSIDEQQDRDIRILPVPMRVEDGEQGKLESGRALARSAFTGFPRGLARADQQRYWGDVEIPYKPYYAYEETLATFGDEPRLANSLLAAYERLTAAVTRNEVREFPSLPDGLRQRYAQAYERRWSATVPDVFLSYTPEDRVWADWIGQVLEQAGVRVIMQGTGYASGADVASEVREAVAATSKTIVLLSAAYVRSARANAVWETLAAHESSRIKRAFIPIRVSDVRLNPPFDAWSTVDLAGTDERWAAEVILRALDQPLPADGISADPVSGARFPGTPPPVWNVPTRNASFTGRAQMLEQLRDQLLRGMAVVMPQALHGLGGVGKTQLALEFAHRFRSDYDLVWWVAAEQDEFIQSAMAEIAPAIGIRRENTDEAAEAVKEALRLGRPYKRWLLIFDNAEDPARLAPHLPQGAGHVIITSRNPGWSTLAVPVEVDAFSRAESVEHLTNRVNGLDAESAIQVARLLGDLPLAIELASAWLDTTGMPVAEYVGLLENQLAQWLDENQPEDYPLSAAATWLVSIDRLGRQWPAAVRLLELCSCFSPEPISMRLLYGEETIKQLKQHDPALQERMLLARIIREVGRYALAKVDQGRSSIQVHRLVQAVIRDSMSDEKRAETEHEVHRILVGGRPPTGSTDNPENWSSYREIWPHLVPSHANTCVEEPVRELLVERVRYLWLRGEYDDAMVTARRLEAFWLEDRGPDDRQLLYLQFHIANVLRSQGDFGAALELDQRVLARQKAKANGDEDVHTLMTSGSLAADLGATGDFQASLELARDTYSRFRNLFGEDYPYTLFAATNLSDALRLSGDCFGARELDTETLTFRRSVLGDLHPLTLNSAANLARDLRETGNFRESANLLRTTLEQCRETLFDEHPETLRTASSLAVSLRKQGAHEEARQLSTQTLEQYRQAYGPDYPDALACSINLACDLSALGQAEEALDLAEETMTAYLSLRGADHQYTLVSGNNQAIYLRSVGRLEESLVLSQRTLEALRRAFGDQHPHTMACAINTANALADSGRLEEAEALERRTHEGFSRLLGANHPDTLFSAGNLAITLRAQNRLEEGQTTMARALSGLERVLGADHPHIEWARRWRRISRDLEPQPV